MSPVEGRLLIACDGIHSAARKLMYPDEGDPRWSGTMFWRGVADFENYLDAHTMIMAGHKKAKFVCYPISHQASKPGRQQINFFAERRIDDSTLGEREDWNRIGDSEDFLPQFESFRFGWLDVPAIIQAAKAVLVYLMIDRDPLWRWTDNCVTLLGDAAHPMYPIGSNGASQAILDASVLTGCLCQHANDLEQGLLQYEDVRRPATSQIVQSNRQDGPEACMQLVEDRAPNGFDKLDDVVSAEELQSIADKYKRLAGFAVEELNSRPSLASIVD